MSDFLTIIEDIITKANGLKCCILLNEVIKQYNNKNPSHPLRLATALKQYLANPIYKALFSEEWKIVTEHKDVEICFFYDPASYPLFDKCATPRTLDAGNIVTNNDYQNGKLLIHVQKTFSLSVESYKPTFFSKPAHEPFHFTEQQLKLLQIARERSEQFIKEHPLPETAKQEKMLGLLTIAVEQILTVTQADKYVGLHEKADRPILSIRHILHYVKSNICNKAEKEWFNDMYLHHLKDITRILCVENYEPDYRSKGGGYGRGRLSADARYDVIFDLFGDFQNGVCLNNNDLAIPQFLALKSYGIYSWEKLLNNHIFLCGRSHFNLQKVINGQGKTELHPLFEARRIGIMTISEFSHGHSRVSFTAEDELITTDEIRPSQ